MVGKWRIIYGKNGEDDGQRPEMPWQIIGMVGDGDVTNFFL